MVGDYKFVNFYSWCELCKYHNVSERDEPCNECLAMSARRDSTKPELWEERKDEDEN